MCEQEIKDDLYKTLKNQSSIIMVYVDDHNATLFFDNNDVVRFDDYNIPALIKKGYVMKSMYSTGKRICIRLYKEDNRQCPRLS